MRTKGWRWFEGLRGRTVLRLLFVLMSSRKRRRKLKRVRQRKRKTVSRLEASRGWGGRERQIKKGYPTMTYLFWHLSFLKRRKKKIAPWPQKCTTVWPRLGKCWGLLVRVFWEHHTRERGGGIAPVNDAASHVTSPVLPTTVYCFLKTREIKLICAERCCLPVQTAMH